MRAVKIAVIVGVILIAVNHGDALVRGEIDPVRLIKMGITVLVPYTVSTVSSVAAIRQLEPRSNLKNQTSVQESL